MARTVFGQVVRTQACDRCGGDGRIAKTPCELCRGAGHEIAVAPAVASTIPAGIDDGQRVRLTGQRPRGRARRTGRRPLRAREVAAGRALRAPRRGPRHAARRAVHAGGAGRHDDGADAGRRGGARARAGLAAGHGQAPARPRPAGAARPRARRPARGAERDDPEPPDRRAAGAAAALRGLGERRDLRRASTATGCSTASARRSAVDPARGPLPRRAGGGGARGAARPGARRLRAGRRAGRAGGRRRVRDLRRRGRAARSRRGARRRPATTSSRSTAARCPDDWAERWKRFYFPVLVAGRLYVRPPWERAGRARRGRGGRDRPGRRVRHGHASDHAHVPRADAGGAGGRVVHRPRLRLGRARRSRRRSSGSSRCSAWTPTGPRSRRPSATPARTTSRWRCGAPTCAASPCRSPTSWPPTSRRGCARRWRRAGPSAASARAP